MLFYSVHSFAVQVAGGVVGGGGGGGAVDPNVTLCPNVATTKMTMIPKTLIGPVYAPSDVEGWSIAGGPGTRELSGVTVCQAKIGSNAATLGGFQKTLNCEYCLKGERVGLLTQPAPPKKNCQVLTAAEGIGFRCQLMINDGELGGPSSPSKGRTGSGGGTIAVITDKETVTALTQELVLVKEQSSLLEQQIIATKDTTEKETLLKQQTLLKEQIAVQELEISKVQETLKTTAP